MGFLDALGRLGGAAMEKMERTSREIEQYMEEYRNFSDEALRQKVKSSSGSRKMASMRLWNERVHNWMARYEYLSDEELKWKFKNTSGTERVACKNLLQERGYGRNN